MVGLLFAVSLPVLAYLPLMPAGMIFSCDTVFVAKLAAAPFRCIVSHTRLCVCLHWFLVYGAQKLIWWSYSYKEQV